MSLQVDRTLGRTQRLVISSGEWDKKNGGACPTKSLHTLSDQNQRVLGVCSQEFPNQPETLQFFSVSITSSFISYDCKTSPFVASHLFPFCTDMQQRDSANLFRLCLVKSNRTLDSYL
jgi:hypothetical protein